MSGLSGKRFLITGASTGIGEHLAYALAARGAALCLNARRKEALDEVAKRCESLGAKVIIAPGDVADRDTCKAIVDATVAGLGGIDVLVNNAGITMWAKLEDITDLDVFERIMRVNYLGSVYCTYFALPHLKASRGLIVAVSSLSGKTGVPTRSAYSASKHAMQGFFDSIRIELAPYGIDVQVVSPGFVATGIRDRALGADGKNRTKSHRNEAKNTMSVEECVDIMVHAIETRKRDVVMTTKAKVGMLLKIVAPQVVDRMAEKASRAEE